MTEALRFTIPGLRLVSGLNVREHWAKRAKRVRSERDQTRLASIASLGPRWFLRVNLPVVVTIIRVGPRMLDSDNAHGSAKHIRDQLASMLGITDGPADSRATWRVEQRKGPYAVEVEIQPAPTGGT